MLKKQSVRTVRCVLCIFTLLTGCGQKKNPANFALKNHASTNSPNASLVKVAQMTMGKQEELLAYFTGPKDTPQIYRLGCPEIFPGGVVGNNMGGLEQLIKGLGWNLSTSGTSVTYDNILNEDHKKVLRDAGWGTNPDILCKYNNSEVTLRKVSYPNSEIKYFLAFKGRRDDDDKMILYNVGCEGAIRGIGLSMNDALNLSPESLGVDYNAADKYDISCVTGAPAVNKPGCKDPSSGKEYYHGQGYSLEDARSKKTLLCLDGKLTVTEVSCKDGYTKSTDGCYASCKAADGLTVAHGAIRTLGTDKHGKADFSCVDGTFRFVKMTSCDDGYTLGNNSCGHNCGEDQSYAHGNNHRLPLDWGRGHGTGLYYCNNGNWEKRGDLQCDPGYRPQADLEACEPIPPNWVKYHCTPAEGGFIELTFDGNGGQGSFYLKGPGLLAPPIKGALWGYIPKFTAKASGLAGAVSGLHQCQWNDANLSAYTCVDTSSGKTGSNFNCYRM